MCAVKVAALAGGVGAGKFLRGLVRTVPPGDVTVIVNTGDDLVVHGLHVAPDLDSVTYWLAGVADRERGWGRQGETFRATEELRDRFRADGSWFGLGDLDLATHLFRSRLMAEGHTLSEATAAIADRFGIVTRLLPMTDDRVTTRIQAPDPEGGAEPLDLHFQEYWVLRGGLDDVSEVRFHGAGKARAAPGVLPAIREADVVVLCPSNPIVSVDPILAVRRVREAVGERRDRVVGISPIVGGAPLRGMADRLLPVAGEEVSAEGVAGHYTGLLGGWVIDEVDRHLAPAIRASGVPVAVTDTIMTDDDKAAALARVALDLVSTA
jgi:LPPG:FO 2-phospho-L-lactate transferase